MNFLIGRRTEWKNKFPRGSDVKKQMLEVLKFGGKNGKDRLCGFIPIDH